MFYMDLCITLVCASILGGALWSATRLLKRAAVRIGVSAKNAGEQK